MKAKSIIVFLILLIADLHFCVNAKAQPQDEVITNDLELYVYEVAREFDFSPYLIASLIYQESRFIVRDNLTQIMGNGRWHKEGFEYCGSFDISNPYVNIRCCGYWLHKWAEQYPDNPYVWLNYWNRGYYLEKETGYAKSVMDRAIRWEEQGDIEWDFS